MEEEAYLIFVSKLKLHLAGHVGAHTHGGLLAVQAMAELLDHYTMSTKGDAGPSGGCGTTGGRSTKMRSTTKIIQKQRHFNIMEKKPTDTGWQSGGTKNDQKRG